MRANASAIWLRLLFSTHTKRIRCMTESLAEAVHVPLDGRDDTSPVRHGRRADNLALQVQLLNELPLLAIEDEKLAVESAEIDALADDDRGRVDAALGQIVPLRPARLAVDGMHPLVLATCQHQGVGERH